MEYIITAIIYFCVFTWMIVFRGFGAYALFQIYKHRDNLEIAKKYKAEDFKYHYVIDPSDADKMFTYSTIYQFAKQQIF